MLGRLLSPVSRGTHVASSGQCGWEEMTVTAEPGAGWGAGWGAAKGCAKVELVWTPECLRTSQQVGPG
jgi:hypothetical protein